MFLSLLDRLAALPWRRQLLAAFLLGLLSALAFPPVHAVPVLLLSVPGLLVLAGAQATWRRAAWIAFAWGWGQGLAGIYWVTEAILTDTAQFWWLVPLAAPALAIAFGVFAVPPVLAARPLPPGWPRLLGFAGAWVLAEMARGVVLTGFPWNLIGSAWAFAALPVQGAALVGVHGLSLATMLLAGLPLLQGWRPWALGALALAGFAGFGAWRLAQPAPPDQPVQLVLVQGNVAQEVKWRQDQRLPIFRRYLSLTGEAARAAVAAAPASRVVVVWPETASPFLLTQDPEARRSAAEALPPDGTLLAGTVRAEWGPEGRARKVWNSLAVVTPEGEVPAVYDKSHLVPFGEYMPLSGLIPIRMVTGGMDFSAGPGPVTLAPPGLPPFGALICYEVIFPGAVTPRPRPDWLVNITNDAWFGVSSGPWQHLAAARLRAVEEGLPLARAAQTGISALFDARGQRLGLLPTGATGTLTLPLPGAGPPTLFARFGLLLPGLAALSCMLVALMARRGGRGMGRGARSA
ncbi:apolipoprotein N-acyltransferase [Paracraurococcus lichenis]|uniref:Apolipoprotein N-acyltransferase n=1 Tax=Paracraurococcus lichenis TaxID=3064888 RepID=A0ABT9E3N6_9PROT|nr:apolipoprotein N-acyltransferase [Paracraurococcus sp. LOR1-02]MDO9710779.1 apolipoprotein N-acyltransferase [Paracraurococcus sp. LOR1-02]